ncbi:MAG: M48 family metalloprotease [Proteobacteria bacterium]|nr:M48 family metalloprotease [Pseudomonadota bacterium]
MMTKSFILSILLLLTYTNQVHALEIIHDVQLSSYIEQISSPLLKVSKLKDVKIYIAKSDQINAFATENNEIIIYSGLVKKTKSENQLQGVLAHELAHLTSKHHLKSKIKAEDSALGIIASTVIGVGAVFAGVPQVGAAIMVGGNASGASAQLAFSRQHENEADVMALKLLERSGISKKGFAEFFEVLEKQEKFYNKPPEFLTTHPSTSKRKMLVRKTLATKTKLSPQSDDFNMFKIKLYALSNPLDKVKNHLSYKADSLEKNLGNSILYFQQADFDKSREALNLAQKQGLQKVWYYDILGQIDFQEGKLKSSIQNYKRSQRLLKKESWILNFQIAESYFALKNKECLDYYLKAHSQFKDFSYTLKRIGDSYSLMNNLTLAHFYFVKYYLKIKNKDLATKHLDLLEQYAEKEKIKDNDLKKSIENLKCRIDEKKCDKSK